VERVRSLRCRQARAHSTTVVAQPLTNRIGAWSDAALARYASLTCNQDHFLTVWQALSSTEVHFTLIGFGLFMLGCMLVIVAVILWSMQNVSLQRRA